MKASIIKSFFILLIYFATVLIFQNCGNVQVTRPSTNSSSTAFQSITLCSSFQDARSVSQFRITQAFVVNLTGLRYKGRNVPDSNANGIPDEEEPSLVSSSEESVTISAKDSDGDGMPDFVENLKGTNPFRDDMLEDGIDMDGVINLQEIQKGTDPQSFDPSEQFVFSSMSESGQDNKDCGLGQRSYLLSAKLINLAPTAAWTDSVNTNEWSLSHGANENIIFIGYRVIPTNLSLSSPLFYGYLLKIKGADVEIPSLLPSDFHLLPSQ